MIFYKEKFRAIRRQLKRPAIQLAQQCDVSRETIHRWEKGTINPSKSHVKAICHALNISISDISDLPDSNLNPNSIVEKIKSVNSLSKTSNVDLEIAEAEFIKQIKQQRKETAEAVLVINALLKSMHSAFLCQKH